MEITLLIKILVVLSGLLGILILLYFYLSREDKSQKRTTPLKSEQPDVVQPELDALLEVIKDKKSTTPQLKEAIDAILKDYGIIKEVAMYSELIVTIAQHPNVNKEIVIKLDKELRKRNPEYKRELDDALKKGLNARAS